ncbi:MAG: hypothetical protein OHK0046_04630 [Anaerolineae bacterium]
MTDRSTESSRILVQIEAGEDANAVRDRLSFLRGKRVLLVWPEEGTALTRKLDLVLIQREAMRRAIRLAIVTHDAEVVRNARELNISTFETIGASERGRWKRGRSKVPTNRNQRPKDAPDPDDLMEVASRVRIKAPSLSRLQNLALRTGILAALIGVVAGVAYVVVPGATVRIAPARQVVEATVDVTVNTDPAFTQVDVDNAIIPAIRITTTLEDTAIINTTGQRDLGAERARGTVLFINNTETPVEIPAGTVVRTGAGEPISFRTTEARSLAGGVGQQTEVLVEALTGGDTGNVTENAINIVDGPLENSITVRNITATSGGQSRMEKAVSDFDRDFALPALRQQLLERALNGLLAQISSDQFIIDQSVAIVREDQITYSHNVGDITPTLTVTMRADVEAVVVDEQLAQSVVLAQMARQIPRGRAIQPESITYQRSGSITVNGDTVTFTMSGRGVVSGRINTADLQQALAGRSLESALLYLNERVDLADGTTPQINITPGGFDRMPILPIRIQIIVQAAP